MGFSNEIYNQATERLSLTKRTAETGASKRMEKFCAEHPDYALLRKKLTETGLALVKAALDGKEDIERRVEDIRAQNLELQEKMRLILASEGLSEDYLKPNYSCTKCEDTGYIDGIACECLLRTMRHIAYEQLNAETPLSICTFDSFNTSIYPDAPVQNGLTPRTVMEKTLEKCRRYAEDFSLSSPSLLFQGKVGLGKTHLSLAIAGEVIKKGFGVVYGSAQSLVYKIEREYFGKSEGSQTDTLQLLKSADLLILDDLGAEFSSTFTVSILYDLVNSRLLASKPTIISTNLDFGSLTEKYTDRIVSRIFGSYSRYQFSGSDVRKELRKARQTKLSAEENGV